MGFIKSFVGVKMVHKEVSELPVKSFGLNRFGFWTLTLTKAIIFLIEMSSLF